MIGEILNQTNLITAEINETFIHCDAQKFNDIVITATIMKKDNLYLITESKTLAQPIVCNVDRVFNKSKFVFISPHLNQIIWISSDSKYLIISISKMLKFINPEKIEGMPDNSPFNLSPFFHPHTSIQKKESCSDIKGQLPFQVLSASWWEPDQTNSFVVFVEKNGIHILHVNHPESNLKSYQLADIVHIIFNRSEDKLNITLFTSTSCHLYTFSYENGAIVFNQQHSIPLQINTTLPFLIQQNSMRNFKNQKKSSYQSKYDTSNISDSSFISENNWLYYTLQDKLVFYDSYFNNVKVTEFQSNTKLTTSIIVTNHLIYYCEKSDNNQYKVYARFIHPDHTPIVILQQKAEINLISFDDDEVFLNTKNSIIHVSLKKEMIDDIFARLVFNKHLDDAIFIGTGLQLSIPYLFQYIINEYVKQKNYTGAFEIMQHEKCDLRDTLLRFLQNGLDRLALHVALTNHHKETMIEKSIPLFADRVIIKYNAFYSFTRSMKQIFGKTDYLLPPNEFSKSPSFDLYKEKDSKLLAKIPLALQFRYNISFGIENDDIDLLKSASKIDLQLYPIFSFSATYKSLLNQYRAMIDTTEVLITEYVDQICTNFAFFQDSVIFLSDKLHIGNQPIEAPFNVSSFAIKGKTLYATDQLLNVYKTELPRIDFIELHEIHPSMKIESNDEIVVFLSISGNLFFENGDSVDGEFIDIALGKDFVYAVDDQGDFYSISIQGQEVDMSKDDSRSSLESDIFNTPDGYDFSHLNNRNNKIRHEVRKKLMNHFIHAVAAAGNVPVLIVSRNLIVVDSKEYKIESFECCNSGKEKCYVGGSGEITVIDKNGTVEKTIGYNQRIGSLISIKKSKIDDSLILLGSASSPMKLLEEPIHSEEEPSFGELRLIASSSSSRFSEKYLLKVFDKDPFRTFIYAIFQKWDQISIPNCTPMGIKSLEPYINDFSEEGASQIFHALLYINQSDSNINEKIIDKNVQNQKNDVVSYHISDVMIKTKFARKAFLEHPDDLKKLSRKQLFSILPEPSSIREITSKTASSHGQISLLEKSSSSGKIFISKSTDIVPSSSISQSSRRIKLFDTNIIKMDNFSEKLLQWSVHPTIVPSRRFKEGKLFVFNCNHILNSDEMLQNVNQVKKLLNSKKLPNTEKLVFNLYLLPKIPAQCPKCLLQRLEAYFK